MAGTNITTGMNIGEVQALAGEMTRGASEIQRVLQQISAKLDSTGWVGPDQQRFEAEWRGQRTAQLNQVIQALEDAGRIATQNANEQTQASNA